MATAEQQVAALARRRERFDVRLQWFGDRVAANLRIGMQARLGIAAQILRDKVVINLSTPVRKHKGARSGRIVVDPTSRSRPGEFPRADTTRLMKDVYYERTGQSAIVGTTLDYGLVLEVARDRSFLRRTLNEMAPTITRILTAGAGGGGATSFPGNNE